MTTNRITFAPAPLDLLEALLRLVYAANALDFDHAYETATYGAIKAALLKALEVELAPQAGLEFRDIARLLYDEAIDNGENIAYQVDLFNEGYFHSR